MRRKKKMQIASVSLASVLLAGAMPAWAAGQEAALSPQATVSVQGVQVAIDPATGRLREPTAAERSALSKALLEQAAQNSSLQARSASGAGATGFVRPLTEQDASATVRKLRLRSGVQVTSMAVPESLVSSLVAEKQADGSVVIHHQGEPGYDNVKATEVTQ